MNKQVDVSIITPFYNVEEYIEECLDSIKNQVLTQYEVILIDDGSTDGSTGIAKQYCSRDERFKYIRLERKGPAAARNTAIRKAVGKYLAFVDSDDLVPPNALSLMYDEAEKNGADIVTGRAIRIRGNKVKPSVFQDRAFSRYSYITDIESNPELVYDTISCNKMIRRDFWTENNLDYPEGILFEDIPMTFKAYNLAEKVVMLDEIVYLWRLREGHNESITQQKSLSIVEDRLQALRLTNEFCSNNRVSGNVVKRKKYKNLMHDLRLLTDKTIDLDDDTLDETIRRLKEYILEDRLNKELKGIPVIHREKYKAILDEDSDRLKNLRKYQKDQKSSITVKRIYNGVVGIFPASVISTRISLMKATLNHEILRETVTRISYTTDTVCIEGCAFIRFIPVRKVSEVETKAWLVDEHRKKIASLQLIKTETNIPNRIEKRKNSNQISYKGTGFVIELNKGDMEAFESGKYRILITWKSCGQQRESILRDIKDDMLKEVQTWNDERYQLSSTLNRELTVNIKQ